MTKEEIKKILDKHRLYLSTEYGVEKVGVFGSYRKGNAHQDSDLDLVIEFSHPIGFRFFELAEFLEELFGIPVEILTPAGVEGIRVPQIAAEIKETVAYV